MTACHLLADIEEERIIARFIDVYCAFEDMALAHFALAALC